MMFRKRGWSLLIGRDIWRQKVIAWISPCLLSSSFCYCLHSDNEIDYMD